MFLHVPRFIHEFTSHRDFPTRVHLRQRFSFSTLVPLKQSMAGWNNDIQHILVQGQKSEVCCVIYSGKNADIKLMATWTQCMHLVLNGESTAVSFVKSIIKWCLIFFMYSMITYVHEMYNTCIRQVYMTNVYRFVFNCV